jgi:hypothetical protein
MCKLLFRQFDKSQQKCNMFLNNKFFNHWFPNKKRWSHCDFKPGSNFDKSLTIFYKFFKNDWFCRMTFFIIQRYNNYYLLKYYIKLKISGTNTFVLVENLWIFFSFDRSDKNDLRSYRTNYVGFDAGENHKSISSSTQ